MFVMCEGQPEIVNLGYFVLIWLSKLSNKKQEALH